MRAPIFLSQQTVQLSQPRQNIQADASAFGAGIAQGLGDLAEGGSRVALAWKERRNQIKREDDAADVAKALNGFEAKADSDFLEDETGFFNQRGRDAVDGYSDYESQLLGLADSFRQTLTNEDQIEAFDLQVERLLRVRRQAGLAHFSEQRAAYQGSVADTTLNREIQNAINLADSAEEQSGAIESAFAAIEMKYSGYPERIEQEQNNALERIHAGVLEEKIKEKDFGGAEAYLNAHREGLSDDFVDEEADQIALASFAANARKNAEEIFSQHENDPNAAFEFIDENYEDDEAAILLPAAREHYERAFVENQVRQQQEFEATLERMRQAELSQQAAFEAAIARLEPQLRPTDVEGIETEFISEIEGLTGEGLLDRIDSATLDQYKILNPNWIMVQSGSEHRDRALGIVRLRSAALNGEEISRAMGAEAQRTIYVAKVAQERHNVQGFIDRHLNNRYASRGYEDAQRATLNREYLERYSDYLEQHDGEEPNIAWREDTLNELLVQYVVFDSENRVDVNRSRFQMNYPAIPEQHLDLIIESLGTNRFEEQLPNVVHASLMASYDGDLSGVDESKIREHLQILLSDYAEDKANLDRNRRIERQTRRRIEAAEERARQEAREAQRYSNLTLGGR